jgi:glutaminase
MLDSRSPIPSPIEAYLAGLHARYAVVRDGKVADYIPELATADPSWFGICLTTTDGRVYEVGDARQRFTIQSISKPFTYGIALEDVGREAVLGKVGVEPSGEAFNSISLSPGTGCPLNPMINAGAIATASLVAGHSDTDRFRRILATYSLHAGRDLDVDERVYESERATGHRNRAIGHMLRNFDVLTGDPESALDLYFRQCSIAIDCRDLSVMAATLANGGVNPITGERAIHAEHVERMLSVMTTCGMYDYAGEWVYWVGLPAKSGVGGGILAVLPGELGIGVFSPPLDARGNSVRGVAVCRDLSHDFDLHFLRASRSSRTALRGVYDLAHIGSKRRRRPSERAVLDRVGQRARVYELQGDLVFSAIETTARRIVDASANLDYAVVDLRRTTRIDQAAARLLAELVEAFDTSGRRLVMVSGRAQSAALRRIEERLLATDPPTTVLTFADRDLALQWCEDALLLTHGGHVDAEHGVALADLGLCHGLDAAEIAHLETLLVPYRFAAGELILRAGEPADALYLLQRGEVSVVVPLPGGEAKRLSTLAAGMHFGELAVLDHSVRTADVRADTAVECAGLSTAAFEALGTTHPATKMRILENLARYVARMVAQLNQEVAILSD